MPRPKVWDPIEDIESIQNNLKDAYEGFSSDFSDVVKETIEDLIALKENLKKMLAKM